MYVDETVYQGSVSIHIITLTTCDDENRRVIGLVYEPRV